VLLSQFKILDDHPFLCERLRSGFPMGDFPLFPAATKIYPNNPICRNYFDFLDEYFVDEVSSGRMIGPLTNVEVERVLSGPFHCSPITIDVQDQGPGLDPKLRVCRNLSKSTPTCMAANEYIDIDKFPMRFTTAVQMAEMVSPSH
jgi:hypothetical protein